MRGRKLHCRNAPLRRAMYFFLGHVIVIAKVKRYASVPVLCHFLIWVTHKEQLAVKSPTWLKHGWYAACAVSGLQYYLECAATQRKVCLELVHLRGVLARVVDVRHGRRAGALHLHFVVK